MQFLKQLTALALLLGTMAGAHAADSSYLGGRTKLTSMHADTNYFVVVRGSGTNASYANVNSSNLLQILKGLVNWPSDYIDTNGTTPAVTLSFGSNTWSIPWAAVAKSGFLRSNDWQTFNGKVPTNGAVIYPVTSSGVPLTLYAMPGQDGNMLNVKDSSGAILMSLDFEGVLTGVGGAGIRLAATSVAGQVWTASDTTGIGSFVTPSGGGGGAGSLPMNLDQFNTNGTVGIKPGVLVTNLQVRGLSPLGLTASRPMFIDASGNATNATGTPDGTKFLRDDGVLATPAGAGTVTSVAASSTTLSVSGSPITGSGTLVVNFSTNAITTQTEDQTPATNDFLVTSDTSTASAKKVALGNLPISAQQQTAFGNLQGATNGLATRASNLEGATNGLTTRATNLEGATNGLTTRATNLEGATNGLATRVTALESAPGGTNYLNLNASRLILTNSMDRLEVTYNGNTNIVIDWGTTNSVNLSPSNTFTITTPGTPPTGLAREVDVLLINTNSSAGYFPTNDLNGGTVYMLPSPSTNRYKFNWRGGRFWISSGQQAEVGTNGYMRTRTGVYRTIEVPAYACTTNSTNWSATFQSGGTNLGWGPKDFWLFSETATNEIHFGFTMPLTWDASTLVARFLFATTNTLATQTNVFSISARTVSGQDFDGATYGTAQIIRTKTTTGKEITYTTATPNLVPSGTPAAGAFTEFKVTRPPGHADDNMQGLLRLYSIQLQYKESIVEPTALP